MRNGLTFLFLDRDNVWIALNVYSFIRPLLTELGMVIWQLVCQTRAS
jgi:hypothetical protein